PPPGCYREWSMSIARVTVLRPNGPVVMLKGPKTWRRFEVAVYGQNLVDFGPMLANFCLHVAGPVRTTFPYSSYTLTGFTAGYDLNVAYDATTGKPMFGPTWINMGCADTPTARKYKGGVDR